MITRRRLRFMWRYLRGNTPWDSGIVPPEIVHWVEAAQAQGSVPGHALDLGCGTGTIALYLAGQGWDVVGVDFAPNAIRKARRKTQQQPNLAGTVTFFQGDVTRLDFLAEGPRFELVIDVGCLHSLLPAQRVGYVAHLARLTSPGATMLLYAFLPSAKRRKGLEQAEVAALFHPAFEIEQVGLGQEPLSGSPSAWYQLLRGRGAPT